MEWFKKKDLENLIKENHIIKKENQKTIKENSFLNFLIESGGVLEGTQGICDAIYHYLINIVKNDGLKKFYVDFDDKESCFIYSIKIPVEIFKGVDTLFLNNPQFSIKIFQSTNDYSDLDRFGNGGDYLAHTEPHYSRIDGVLKLESPQFEINLYLNNNLEISGYQLYGKINHELVHAKINFNEYIENVESLKGDFFDKTGLENNTKPFNQSNIKYINNKRFFDIDVKNEADRILKRYRYLISKDEINARTNQLYYELDELNKKYKFNFDLKKLIYRCPIYSNFINEIEDFIDKLEKEKDNNELNIYFRNRVQDYKNLTVQKIFKKLKFVKMIQINNFYRVAKKWKDENFAIKV